jgi:hypothetical protein
MRISIAPAASAASLGLAIAVVVTPGAAHPQLRAEGVNINGDWDTIPIAETVSAVIAAHWCIPVAD